MFEFSMEATFWFFAFAVGFTYGGYPFCMWAASRLFRRRVQKGDYEPTVSVILSAFNEEKWIEKKLHNLLTLDYPREKLEILVGSDGGSDMTDMIISKFEAERIRFFRFVKNLGKPHVLNSLVREAHGTLLLFTDARQELAPNALRELVVNFNDTSVGCASGELYFRDSSATEVSQGMDAYWRYEKFIRRCESDVDSMLGATGALYAVRRNLFNDIPLDILVDDMYLPLSIVGKGHRAVFEPAAHAYDRPSKKGKEEFKRKVRTLAGNYQVFQRFPNLLNPFQSRVAFQLVCHKLLRLLVPFFLIGLTLSNLFLLHLPIYGLFFAVQISFYLLAFLGALRDRQIASEKSARKKSWAGVAYTFCLLNYSAFMGLLQFLSKKRSAAWEKAYA